MIIFPAIDLSDGQVVRLSRGDMAQKTVYSDDPPAFARQWAEAGAEWLHVVDLDAATEANHNSRESIRAVCQATKLPVQVGGGLRTMADIEDVLSLGVRRVILGTVALRRPALVSEAVREFGEGIAVSIDSRDGLVSVRGWLEDSEVATVDLARQMAERGVERIICTDITSDGMLTGPNLPALREVAEAIDVPLIAAGGVSKLEDIHALKALEPVGLEGAVTGRAIYTGDLDLAEAIAAAKQL